MNKIVNLGCARNRRELASKISSQVTKALINFSEVQDNGRFMKGADVMHFNQYLPDLVEAIMIKYVEGK